MTRITPLSTPPSSSSSGSAPLTPLQKAWRALFETPAHLDSVLAKVSDGSKNSVALFLKSFLRAPVATCHAFGQRLQPGEPWNFSREQLLQWTAPERIFASLQRSAAPSVHAGLEDFPPEWIAEIEADWGDAVRADLVRALSLEADLCLRVQGGRSAEKVLRSLDAQGSPGGRQDTVLPGAVRFSRYTALLHTEAFKDGWYEIQDVGSQLMALFALDPQGVAPLLSVHPTGQVPSQAYVPSETAQKGGDGGAFTVIDACAGAGGKTLALSDQMQGRGRLYAYDISLKKIQALKRRLKRLKHTNNQAMAIQDMERLKPFHRTADVVLVDAPCSGWGVARRNPDLKWAQKPGQGLEKLSELQALQLKLLGDYAQLVRSGGSLIYGVCTFRKAETTAVAEAFSQAFPDFRLAEGGFVGPGWSDGFFMQRWVRI